MGEKAYQAADAIGTLHVSHFVPFESAHFAFFTVSDGDFAKHIQDFADKNLVHFRYSLSARHWRAANPSRKNAKAFFSGHWTTTIRPSGFTAPIQALGSRH